ncbi:MAG: AMP-binding protein [Vibrio sp.]
MNVLLAEIEQVVRQQPNAVAFTGYLNGELATLTYQQFWQHASDAAQRISALSCRCIALREQNGLPWAVIDIAAQLANVVLVPVPHFFSAAQVTHLLTQSGADILIGEWPISERIATDAESIAPIYGLPITPIVSDATEILPKTCKVTFTSGSTGHPKGVCLSADNLYRVSQSLANVVGPTVKNGAHLAILPLATLLENIASIYVPLLLGESCILLPGREVGLNGSSQFDPAMFATTLATYQPSSVVLTPALLEVLVALVTQTPDLGVGFQFIAVGGARVSSQVIAQAHRLGLPAYQGYGLSECASVVSVNTPTHLSIDSAGQVLEHQQIHIDEQGQLWVKGNVALGYIGEPFTPEWFASGDLAQRDDKGYLTITGRLKNQLISAFGRNVSPEWVETEAHAYAPLRSLVVVGDGEKALTAVVVHDSPAAVMQALRILNPSLPDYAQLKYCLCRAEYPKERQLWTANGKPLRLNFEQWANEQRHYVLPVAE